MENVIHIPEETIKKRRRHNLLGILVLALVSLPGFFLLCGGIVKILTVQVNYPEKMAVNEISSGEYYYIDDLTIVDEYSTLKEAPSYSAAIDGYGLITKRFLLGRYTDKTGTVCYVSVNVDMYEYTQRDFADLCKEFLEMENRPEEGLKVSGCFAVYTHSPTNSLNSSYERAYAKYAAPGEVKTNYDLIYQAATADAFLSEERSGNFFFPVMGAILFVPCAIGIILLLRKRKRLVSELPAFSGEVCVKSILRSAKIASISLGISLGIHGAGTFLAVFGGITGKDPLLYIGLFSLGIGCFAMVPYATCIYSGAAKKLLEKEDLSLLTVASDLNTPLYLQEKIRCGRKVLLLNDKLCLPLRAIAWIYIRVDRSRAGLVVGRNLVIRTTGGKKFETALAKEDLECVRQMLEACAEYLPTNLIVGHNKEAKQRYRALLKEQKATGR